MAKAPAPTLYYFISMREKVVTSTTGRSILFEPKTPTHVPREMHREVMEKGIMPCDKDGNILDSVEAVEGLGEQEAKVLLPPEDPDERSDKIVGAMKALVKRNSPHDFSAGGVPSAQAITAALGWRVDTKEVRALWAKLKPELLGTASE